MKNRKLIIKEIDRWLRDYEEVIGESCGDEDTFYGSAYNLLCTIRREISKLS